MKDAQWPASEQSPTVKASSRWSRNRFTVLTLIIVLYLALIMATPRPSALTSAVGQILLVIVLAGSIAAIFRRTGSTVVAAMLTLPFIVLTMLRIYSANRDIGFAADAFAAAALTLTAVLFMGQILEARTVNHDTIAAGVIGYLLLAVMWTKLYAMTYAVDPRAFYVSSNVAGEMLGSGNAISEHLLYYYSFVTLTTLGYGDVYPVTPAARMLAAMEALAGQIYLTVLVAGLVGMGVAKRLSR